MPTVNSVIKYSMPSAGATKAFPVSQDIQNYKIVATGGTITLGANMDFTTSGSPLEHMEYRFIYGGGVTVSSYAVTFFGTALTAAQALYPAIIYAYYNGSAWEITILPDAQSGNVEINGADITAATITNTQISTVAAIALSKLAGVAARGYLVRGGANGVIEGASAKTSGTFVGGDGTDVGPLTMSGDATLSSGVITIANNAITTAKINTAQVTIAKLEASAQLEVITIPCSFESGEVGTIKFKMPFPGSITSIYAIATKAIANTDAGTVVLKNNAGTTMTVTTPISFAAADAYGTSYSSAVTANNTFVADDLISVVTAKTTAGGKVLLSLKIQRA